MKLRSTIKNKNLKTTQNLKQATIKNNCHLIINGTHTHC